MGKGTVFWGWPPSKVCVCFSPVDDGFSVGHVLLDVWGGVSSLGKHVHGRVGPKSTNHESVIIFTHIELFVCMVVMRIHRHFHICMYTHAKTQSNS